jgi:hypothetical protein
VHSMEVKKNKFIEQWAAYRENSEYLYKWTPRRVIGIGLLVVFFFEPSRPLMSRTTAPVSVVQRDIPAVVSEQEVRQLFAGDNVVR